MENLQDAQEKILCIIYLKIYTSHKNNCRARLSLASLLKSARAIFSGSCFYDDYTYTDMSRYKVKDSISSCVIATLLTE